MRKFIFLALGILGSRQLQFVLKSQLPPTYPLVIPIFVKD